MRQNVNSSNNFTLLELLVGMTVLTILMLMLFQFLISSQRTLNWSDSMWRIYENSRVIFDLIEQDLQACVTSSLPGEEIPFFMGDEETGITWGDALKIAVVSSTNPPDIDATSKLCEISYRYHSDISSIIGENQPYVLYRKIVSNANEDWDYLTSDTWYDNDHPNSPDFQKVVGGVKNFEIKYFYNSETEYDVPDGGTDTSVKPTSIRIMFDLFDENLTDASESVQNQTKRGFYKEIDLRKF